MVQHNFIDHVKIHCRSGNGGKGSSHLRREKFVAKGGPDGGDGGRGGNIILKGNKQLWTLLHLRYQKHTKAGNGGDGGAQRSTGAAGEDKVLEVPLGTIATNTETGEKLAEITHHNQEEVILRGGKGGLGNVHFKSSTRQTPRYAQPGEPGKEAMITLELKLLADIGLVGFPNAGKSTLLSVLSAAKPKIANYPFTTLVPNLGVVSYHDHKSFVIADIPGIIEDAHKGKGIGHRFLRHIERNAVLLFTIPADSKDITAEYNVLLDELKEFNEELLHKPRLLAISKSDLLDEELKKMITPTLPEDVESIFISAVTQTNLQDLKDKLWTKIDSSS